MKKIFTALTTLFTCFCLTSCSQPVSKQDMGTVSGGVVGGLIGSHFGKGTGQLVAIGAGTLLGAYMGNAIGKNMDDMDRLKMNQALESNPVGKPAYWKNAQNGNSYTVIPESNVTVDGNPYCREYRTKA